MTKDKPSYIRRKARKVYQDLLSFEGPAHKIALGVAIGTFVTFSPLLGLHSLLCILFCFLFKANIPAAFLFSWIGNPITYPAINWLNYEIGRLVLMEQRIGFSLTDISWETVKESLILAIPSMMVGSVPLGLLFATGSYFLVRFMIKRYRRKTAGQAVNQD